MAARDLVSRGGSTDAGYAVLLRVLGVVGREGENNTAAVLVGSHLLHDEDSIAMTKNLLPGRTKGAKVWKIAGRLGWMCS